MAAIQESRADQPKTVPVPSQMPPPLLVSDAFAKDAILAWYRGEFAAANAIIDALCGHLAQVASSSNDYDLAFAAIHHRRLNWIPVLQMQKYHSIADVTLELRNVAEKKIESVDGKTKSVDEKPEMNEEAVEKVGNDGDEAPAEYDTLDSEITDSGSLEVQHSFMNNSICSNHEECEGRPSEIKLTQGFTTKEFVKGHPVNAVKGLRLYEDVLSESQLGKLADFVKEIHAAGQNGELSGETFILFNKQVKGNKRELIQLGVPIFGQIKDIAKSKIEPIPSLLHGVIDHLIQWQLIPEYTRPNGCIINFFEEGEFSQPFLKPPHLDQPLSTLLLSESTMAFGRILMSENDGNYKGPLMLSLKQGSLLVMRGNSADMARHVMCPSPNKRVSITFFRVREGSYHGQSTSPPLATTSAMTVWQPGTASPLALPNGAISGHQAMDMIPRWGMFGPPMVMLTPMHPMTMNPNKLPRGGTGVFLPWKGHPRKHSRYLPPRAHKGRVMALPPPVESHREDSTSEPTITVEG
ncbi:RNA demethylase ALKBH10B-like [Vicia villosa]|uniref:RNA demethylase ALKBH10B-like n=1 Tax=Vicia villosa TaxID=3911 RepID=UPI00273B78A5|nr:RNA demethylase ALKBH10B-like [Vicia villosa]